ncbi:MAG TPA: sigma-70 family RNA polymerase sigma factor [Thermomicrobiales bacterium]|nr:sigma-70 family RNA polymerase sigma factor [Thermomicrobiales bacterium]
MPRAGARTETALPETDPGPEPGDDLLAAAARRDPAAFDALYERYAGPIYRFCYVRLGSREAAEDAAGAVFLKALGAIERYRAGNFAGWLYRIAANTVVDARRASRPTVAIDAIAEPLDPSPRPDAATLQLLDSEELRDALATLPDDQRAAVELQLAGWTGERIATALRRSPEAVRMLRHRALTRLRVLLAEPDHDDQPHGGRR